MNILDRTLHGAVKTQHPSQLLQTLVLLKFSLYQWFYRNLVFLYP